MKDKRAGNRLTRRRFLGATAAGAAMLTAGHSARSSEAALDIAENSRDELVQLLTSLIAQRSHSGESAENAQEIVLDYLSRLPYRIERFADKPSQFIDHPEFMPPTPPGDGPFVNVVAKPQRPIGANLAMFAHIDTHSVEDGWTTDPYQSVIKDGKLYGLGSADDKGGIAAMLVAASALAKAGGPTPILISSHGKGGGSRGSLPVFERLNRSGVEVDAVLYAHPAETGNGLADVKHIVRGVLDVAVTVEGWQGAPLEIGLPDSALWSDGGNALDVCWKYIDSLKKGVLSTVDVNVGKLTAGDRAGAVPDQATAQFRVLFDGDASWKDLLRGIQREAETFEKRSNRGDRRFHITAVPADMRTNPGAVAWNAPTCRTLRNSILAVTNRDPSSYPNHYGGDIRYPIRLLDAPAFGIGSIGGNFYGPNEWVDVDDLVKMVAVIIRTMYGWAEL